MARLVAVLAAVVVLAPAYAGAALADDDTTTAGDTAGDTTTTTTTTTAPAGSCAALTRQLEALLAQLAAAAQPSSAASGLQSQVDAACSATMPTSGAPAGVAAVPGGTVDRDCRDFASQQEAQSYFTSIGGSSAVNADRLDADHDGIACEDYAYDSLAPAGAAQVAEVPVGGIETGDGSFAP